MENPTLGAYIVISIKNKETILTPIQRFIKGSPHHGFLKTWNGYTLDSGYRSVELGMNGKEVTEGEEIDVIMGGIKKRELKTKKNSKKK